MNTVTIWITDSAMNRIVTDAAIKGLRKHGVEVKVKEAEKYDGDPVPSMSYGVLRGTGAIYRDCARNNVPWWNIDRGFFGERSTEGYFRVGYCHLQPKFVPNRSEDSFRWRSLRIPLKPWKRNEAGTILICPPEGICEFYGIDQRLWLRRAITAIPAPLERQITIRLRTDRMPIDKALAKTRCVVTHSSNVAVEAIISGVPAVADTGMVRSWNGMMIQDADQWQEQFDREQLCIQAANTQFTLAEFQSGLAWDMLKLREDKVAA